MFLVQPGDCVILNSATSTVSQAVIQICATLQLRTVAVASDHGDFEKTVLWLKSLGATEVLKDKGSIKVSTSDSLCNSISPPIALESPTRLRVMQ